MTTQGLDGAEREAAHRPRLATHDPGSLFGRESRGVAQGQCLLLIGREMTDGASKLADRLLAQRHGLDAHSVARLGDRPERLSGLEPTLMVDDSVARDPEGERGEWPPAVTVARQRPHDPLEHELREVLRILAAPNAHGDVRVDAVDQGVVQTADRVRVSTRRSLRQGVDIGLVSNG